MQEVNLGHPEEVGHEERLQLRYVPLAQARRSGTRTRSSTTWVRSCDRSSSTVLVTRQNTMHHLMVWFTGTAVQKHLNY